MALSMPTLYDRKKKIVDIEPSKASVTFLNKFRSLENKRQRLSTQPHRVCGRYSNPGRRPVAAFGRLSFHYVPALTPTSVPSCASAQL